MWICLIFVILGVLSLVFYLIEKCKNYSLKGVLIKTAVSLFFIATALAGAFQKSVHILNPFVISGLFLGLLGDIWLDLKYVYKEHDKLYTYSGFIAFGVGHILFIVGLLLEFIDINSLIYLLIPIGGSVLFMIANLLLEKPMKHDFKDMKIIVSVYAFLLSLNPFVTLLLCVLTNFTIPTLITFFIGGILFVISDLVLSNTYFGEGHETPIDFILNYLTYYGAQFVIAFSLVLL